MECVSSVHPSLNKGKKKIVVWYAFLRRKSSNKMMKTRSPDELNYLSKQIMEQFLDQVEATREFQQFLNENLEINRIILASYSICFNCYLFSLLFSFILKKINRKSKG